jgi:hypothetical protein
LTIAVLIAIMIAVFGLIVDFSDRDHDRGRCIAVRAA